MVVLKTKEEIAQMKKPNRIVAEILRELEGMCRSGVSTMDLEDKARQLTAKYKVKPAFYQYRGYPAYLCASVNDEVVHGIPRKDKVLKDGDIVSLDFGVIDHGFVGDAAVTVEVGKVSDQVRKLLEVTREALNKAVDRCRAGEHLSDIAHAVQTLAETNGFSVVRDFVGHGVGRVMHEDPQVPNFGVPRPNLKLREGMVLALEPMINIGTWRVKVQDDGWTVVTEDGQPSAHFEHSVAVTDKGPLVLSRLN